MMQYDVFLIGLGSSCIMLQWSDQQRIGKDRTIVRKVKGVCVGGWVGGEDQKGKRSVGVGGCSYSDSILIQCLLYFVYLMFHQTVNHHLVLGF